MFRNREFQEVDPNLDLVDDRAIKSGTQDLFGRTEFAVEAARIIHSIQTPANIAIYAPWGTGKTSLAYLVKEKLDQEKAGFVYFNAFKYAEAPLRRNFIKSIASDLGVDGNKFNRGLYEEHTVNDFNYDEKNVRPILKIIWKFAAAAVALTFVIAFVLALASGKHLWAHWASNVLHILPAIFASTAIVGPTFALIQTHLTVTKKRYAPQGDEEFENLFSEIVEKALAKNKNWDRLVIFIDELDRCASDEVASTLETLRTFLEVESCVFIVAADRAVLETAVAHKSRQETPFNYQNPYYSSGSSYLDKIFQFQWQLPPVRSNNLTRFALSLVKNRAEGLWSEIDPGEVLSVLIPLHVQSPRRVKELLNAYAMTYRIAERQIGVGHLRTNLVERAAELAKLVCLQLEFPTFANDLPNEPRLPEFVLNLVSDPNERMEKPVYVSDEIWSRAIAYAGNQIELDTVIAGRDGNTSAEPQSVESENVTKIVTAQGQLLVRYLSKTQKIPGPKADLIFMEDAGYVFGLPTNLVDQIRDAALEARIDATSAIFETLTDEQRIASLQLLGSYVHQSLPGIEGLNTLHTLFGMLRKVSLEDLAPIANELADKVNSALQGYELDANDIVGALKLGLTTSRYVGKELRHLALIHDWASKGDEAAIFILAQANSLADEEATRIGEILAVHLGSGSVESLPTIIEGWDEESANLIFSKTLVPLLDVLEGLKVAPTATNPKPLLPTEATLKQFQEILNVLKVAGRSKTIESVLLLTLGLDTVDARSFVAREFPSIKGIQSSDLIHASLQAVAKRTLKEKPIWLDNIDLDSFAALSDAKLLLELAIQSAWTDEKLMEANEYFTDLQLFLNSARRLALHLAWIPTTILGPDICGKSKISVFDDVSINKWNMSLRIAKLLEDHDLLGSNEWRGAYLELAILFASTTPAVPASREPQLNLLLLELIPLAHSTERDLTQNLFTSIGNSPWMSAPEKILGRIQTMTAIESKSSGETISVEAKEFEDLLRGSVSQVDAPMIYLAIKRWLLEIKPPISESHAVISRFATGKMPSDIREALRLYSNELSPLQRSDLLESVLGDVIDLSLSPDFLESINYQTSDLSRTVDIIVTFSQNASNENQRRAALKLWNALQLTNTSKVRLLAQQVLKPLIVQSKSSRELAIQNLNLVHSLPDSDKREIEKSILENVSQDELVATNKRLVKAGLISKKTFAQRMERLKG